MSSFYGGFWGRGLTKQAEITPSLRAISLFLSPISLQQSELPCSHFHLSGLSSPTSSAPHLLPMPCKRRRRSSRWWLLLLLSKPKSSSLSSSPSKPDARAILTVNTIPFPPLLSERKNGGSHQQSQQFPGRPRSEV